MNWKRLDIHGKPYPATQPANGLGQSGFSGLDLLWVCFGWFLMGSSY